MKKLTLISLILITSSAYIYSKNVFAQSDDNMKRAHLQIDTINPLTKFLDDKVINDLSGSSAPIHTIELVKKRGNNVTLKYEQILEFWYKSLLPRTCPKNHL